MNITGSRGFTLIELLVAISILAIVAVLGWRGLDTIVRARVSLNSELESTRGLQLAFAQMQSDTGHIASSADIGGNRSTLVAQAGRLILVRTVFAENQPTRVQVVAYRVRDGVLTRRESVATRNLKELDTAWTAAADDSDDALPAVKLHSGVRDMRIRLWEDKIGWRAMDTSSPAAANAAPGIQRPAGIEVSLQLIDRPGSLVKAFLLGAT